MNGENSPEPEMDPMDVAACAYLIWEKEGKPHGRDVEHWLQAETLLRAMHVVEPRADKESAPAARKRKGARPARQDKPEPPAS